ncbi:MAG TPA: hypothetical protein VE733_15415 [Streptosporangiaceae bacterium]|nr:hypothetical protein [Streptosporangiaceae bacterium]
MPVPHTTTRSYTLATLFRGHGRMKSAGPKEGDNPVSPAAKLCGFLLLLAAIFAGAHAAGAHLGPVTIGVSQSGGGGSGSMNMGGSGSMNMGGHSPVAPGRSGRP